MTRLWHYLFGIRCRFCGDRVAWPATETRRYGGVCAECRAYTLEWLAELGATVLWPNELRP